MHANRTSTRMAVLAILALAGATAVAAPAMARPPWERGGHGKKDYWGPPGYMYYAPPVYYARPPVYYAPPPVYYAPPSYMAPGLSFGINVPLR